jgi:hypothetical protein
LSDPSDEDDIERFFTPVLKAVLESLGVHAGPPEVYKMIYPAETTAHVRRLEEYQSGTQFFVVLPLKSDDRDFEAQIKFTLDEKGNTRLDSSNIISGDYFPNESPTLAEESSLKPWIKMLLPLVVSSILRLLLDQSKVVHDLSLALPIIIDNVKNLVNSFAKTLEEFFKK